MPTLNGKTYEMQYLTDEETAVINAMRNGAEVNAYFFNSTDKEAEKHVKWLKPIAREIIKTELTNPDGAKFDSHEIKLSKHKIYHFVDK